MKVFGLKDVVEIQGDNYVVEKIDAKGINVRHMARNQRTWLSRVNVEKLFDRGELKRV